MEMSDSSDFLFSDFKLCDEINKTQTIICIPNAFKSHMLAEKHIQTAVHSNYFILLPI